MAFSRLSVEGISHVIQPATVPVFLLAAVGEVRKEATYRLGRDTHDTG